MTTLLLGLAFLLELLALLGFGRATFAVVRLMAGSSTGWIAAAVVVGAGVALWSRFAAPRSGRRLDHRGLVLFKSVFFGLAALAWAVSDGILVGAGFAVLALLSLAVEARSGAVR